MVYTVLSENARLAIDRANRLAAENGHDHMDTAHLLLAVLVDEADMSARVLMNLGVDLSALRADIEQCLQVTVDNEDVETPSVLPGAKRIIDSAFALAAGMQHACVDCDHVLLGLLQESAGAAVELLARHGVTFDSVVVEVHKQRDTRC